MKNSSEIRTTISLKKVEKELPIVFTTVSKLPSVRHQWEHFDVATLFLHLVKV